MTDFYPREEGAVFDSGSYIIPCYPDGAISEMSSVKMGTTVAGRISVAVSAAIGDGVGIALRESTGAGAPKSIPVLFYGIAKVTFTPVVAAGEYAMNLAAPTTFTAGGDNTSTLATLVLGGGASYVMGLVIQATGGAADEALLLVGKTW